MDVLAEYEGQYVALEDDSVGASVVAHSDRIHYVIREAQEKGFNSPVITFVPQADMICLY